MLAILQPESCPIVALYARQWLRFLEICESGSKWPPNPAVGLPVFGPAPPVSPHAASRACVLRHIQDSESASIAARPPNPAMWGHRPRDPWFAELADESLQPVPRLSFVTPGVQTWVSVGC